MTEEHYRADTLDITFDVTETSLEETVNALCDKAEQMIRNGTVLLVLSDRNIAKTVCRCLPHGGGGYPDASGGQEPALRCQHHR